MKSRNIIFGCGSYFHRYISEIHNMDIIAVVDNDREKQGKTIEQYSIDSPSIILKLQFDRVYIVCLSVNPIREQLLKMGIPENKIFYYFDLLDSDYNFVHRKNKLNGQGTKISIVSHDFSITGAPNSLYQLVRCLIRKGFCVKVASPTDGEMNSIFFETGADVLVDSRLQSGTLDKIEWINECDIIFVNTVQMYYLLRKRDISIPLIWWLHEPLLLYKSVVPGILNSISKENIEIVTVSKVADDAFHTMCNAPTKRFLYGMEDKRTLSAKREHSSIRFIIIGPISKLKGHDVLLEAIRLLNLYERQKCDFIMIGDDTSNFAKNIIREMKQLKISYTATGILSHEDTLKQITNADVLICASRAETMSMAVTEAMMLEVPVIVSDKAGITEYMENRINGLLFESENSKSLVEKIRFFLYSSNLELEQIGKKGRIVFEEVFMLERFAENLDKVIESIVM